MANPQVQLLGKLLHLEKQARHAPNIIELGDVMVNTTLELTPYHQAVFWRMTPGGRIRIEAVSGVDQPDAHAPYTIFLRRLIRRLVKKNYSRNSHTLTSADAPARHRDEWPEWLTETVLWQPLIAPNGNFAGGLLFMRSDAWTKAESAALSQAADAFAHALHALERGPFSGGRASRPKRRRLQILVLVGLILLLLLPVRQSVLAPMAITPAEPLLVSAPMDGVIKKIEVAPGQTVQTGQLLFRLDDVSQRNQYAVARETLEVARAEYMRAAQKAFVDAAGRSQMLLLKAQIEQKAVEVEYMAELLARGRVTAAQNGIAIFSDPRDWEGKPVMVGEKVMVLANPERIQAEIQLPAADAINLEIGVQTLLFLNIAPLQPIHATLHRASYEARVTPDGVLAFQLHAQLDDNQAPPRIGLRGTAKIYGPRVTLFYYLMRRPLAALRQMVGV